MQSNKPERVAPDWEEGDDFIQWCRRVSRNAYELSRDRGYNKAIDLLLCGKMGR